ncbi:MAG: hypothetical protein DWQ01_04150 [Planctomycetota bacterium]|nr:MAG: hypothetical protein DWQ01_04150 [Planctomycetota bacterium]
MLLRILLFGGFLLGSAATVEAQATLHRFPGTSPLEQSGLRLSMLGDLDGDQVADFLVATPLAEVGGVVEAGRAEIYSGATRTLIRTHAGTNTGQHLGWASDDVGDLDFDGLDDYLLASPGWDGGRVQLLSGADGSLIHEKSGQASYDDFGTAVAGGGDVNGDGLPDFAITSVYFGDLNVYSGFDFSLIHQIEACCSWGGSLSLFQDLDQDGFDEVAWGSFWDDEVAVYSGQTGALLHFFSGPSHSDFGRSIAAIPDINGDGIEEIAIGSPLDSTQGQNAGRVVVYSGSDGAFLQEFFGQSQEQFGYAISGGDFDQDGFGDLAVGAYLSDENGSNAGSCRIIDGASWQFRFTLTGEAANDHFGKSLSQRAADVDDDGFPDFLVGAPDADPNGIFGAGETFLISGHSGMAVQAVEPGIAGQNNTVIVDRCTPGEGVYLTYSLQRGSHAVPGCNGLFLDLDQPSLAGIQTASGIGRATFTGPVPASLQGRRLHLQALEPRLCRKSQVRPQDF